MMKKTAIFILFCSVAVFAGCRKTDYRKFTLSVPGMTAENAKTVCEAVHYYEGVLSQQTKCDVGNKTITVVFDSLKVAKMNIVTAIRKKGIEVDYPAKREGPAGYINSREEEFSPSAK